MCTYTLVTCEQTVMDRVARPGRRVAASVYGYIGTSRADIDSQVEALSWKAGPALQTSHTRTLLNLDSLAMAIRSSDVAIGQGLTLVPNSAQLELFCPPYNPT